MVKIIYIEHSGTSHEVNLDAGDSLMQGAVHHGIPGIDAECGGACVCATCHIYINEPWQTQLPPAEELEQLTLDFASLRTPQSRLACQVKVSEALEGLVVHLPSNQG